MTPEDVPEDDVPPKRSLLLEEALAVEESSEAEPEEPRDPLEVALERAEFAEKEIAYKEAEIQNAAQAPHGRERPRPFSTAAWGMARRLPTVLARRGPGA